MARYKDPDRMTAEEEIRSALDWAQRTGHLNIAAALRRALDKWPITTASATEPGTVAAFLERDRRAQAAVDQAIAATGSATATTRHGKRSA
jgi:hypothetical protein